MTATRTATSLSSADAEIAPPGQPSPTGGCGGRPSRSAVRERRPGPARPPAGRRFAMLGDVAPL